MGLAPIDKPSMIHCYGPPDKSALGSSLTVLLACYLHERWADHRDHHRPSSQRQAGNQPDVKPNKRGIRHARLGENLASVMALQHQTCQPPTAHTDPATQPRGKHPGGDASRNTMVVITRRKTPELMRQPVTGPARN